MTTEEQVGVLMTPEHIELAYDIDRDAHSLDMRIRAWRWQEAMYHRSRNNPMLEIPEKEHDIYFMSADRGEGKTVSAAAIALLLRVYGGYQVYSTNSFLFGVRVPPIVSLTFSAELEPRSVMFNDESHTMIDTQADGAYRNRAASDSVAMMRKDQIIAILSSAKERRVSRLIREDVKWLIRPEQMGPPPGGYRLPPWCYLRNRVAGPYPWQGATRMEQLGHRRMAGKLTTQIKAVPPQLIYEASKLVDSWDKPELLATMEIDAERMRKHTRESGEDGDPAYQVATALAEAVNDGWRAATPKLDWMRVADVLIDYGCKLDEREIHAVMRRKVDGMNTTGRVPVANLMTAFLDLEE